MVELELHHAEGMSMALLVQYDTEQAYCLKELCSGQETKQLISFYNTPYFLRIKFLCR